MMPIWLANPGEEFQIDRVKTDISLVTAKGKEMPLSELVGCRLSIVSKTSDSIYGVFRGHRIVFDKLHAQKIYGTVLGKTTAPVHVIAADACTHHCASCGGCIH